MSGIPWCSTCGKDVHTIECQECAKDWVANDLEKLEMEAEIERLRGLLLEVSTYFHGAIKSNILKALQPKEGVMTLFEKIIQVQAMFPELCKPSIEDEDQIASLTAEIERLRALVKDAYGEGYSDATTETMYLDDNWKQSATYDALQPKEGGDVAV